MGFPSSPPKTSESMGYVQISTAPEICRLTPVSQHCQESLGVPKPPKLTSTYILPASTSPIIYPQEA